jgi:hypothetical protein
VYFGYDALDLERSSAGGEREARFGGGLGGIESWCPPSRGLYNGETKLVGSQANFSSGSRKGLGLTTRGIKALVVPVDRTVMTAYQPFRVSPKKKIDALTSECLARPLPKRAPISKHSIASCSCTSASSASAHSGASPNISTYTSYIDDYELSNDEQ